NYFYLFLAMRYYGEFRQWLEAEFSNAKELSLRWYRNFLLLALCGITLSWGFYLINSLGANLTYTQSWWEYVFIAAIIYVLSIAAYNQPQVVYLRFKPSELPKPEENKLVLPAAEMEAMGEQVLQQFLERKLYLNPKLTLSQMAADLSINSNLLSQLINTVFGKNFNQFVNDYRIEEFKKEARKPDNRHLSLLAIAMNCGFNSKATFNRVFKNASGLSPKEYLNSAP
ncbi:MAG: helix-turn-helix transcriptional regulator, partial [Bacteroidota bacterium]